MTFTQIKEQFKKEISHLYPDTEIETFFHLLLEHHYGIKRIDLALEPGLNNTERDLQALSDDLARLKRAEPIQYITGYCEFMGLRLRVNNSVLIPRPETEELVDWILSSERENPKPKALDIGTGSGCIAINLAKQWPAGKIKALDISEEAIEVASLNASSNKVQVDFVLSDVLNIDRLEESYDIIVSNPPYVRESERELMRDNVLKHEPGEALFVSDQDPLLYYRKISQLALNGLKEGGALYFEINEYLSEELRSLLLDQGWPEVEIRSDIYGKPRMIRATKN